LNLFSIISHFPHRKKIYPGTNLILFWISVAKKKDMGYNISEFYQREDADNG